MTTSLEQFRASLRSDAARTALGFTMPADEANWIADDDSLATAYYLRWTAAQTAATGAPAAPSVSSAAAPPAQAGWVEPAVDYTSVPGRSSGFVLGLLGTVFVSIPLVAVPLGIIGWVLSHKALRVIPYGALGRKLAVAGLTLSIIAACLSGLIMLIAIPGALTRNF